MTDEQTTDSTPKTTGHINVFWGEVEITVNAAVPTDGPLQSAAYDVIQDRIEKMMKDLETGINADLKQIGINDFGIEVIDT